MQSFYLTFVLLTIRFTFGLISFDLTHTIQSTNPSFPGTGFNFTQKSTIWKRDESNEEYFHGVNTFIINEHFGTHIDAPYHMFNTSWTVEQIPFDRLVSIQALIVDVSKSSLNVENYQIKIEDLNEEMIKQIKGFFVLLFYTGKSKFWPDQKAYAGGNTLEELEFPGLSAQLASYLVEKYSKNLVGVGIDTLSIDPGSSKHYHAHRILFKENIYVLENVAGLELVLKHLFNRRETVFAFDVLPMKLENGTGAPCRLVARLENFENTTGGWFGFLIFSLLLAVIGLVAKAIYDLKFNSEKTFS